MSTLHQVAALEASRAARNGRWFSLVRVAPVGWAARDEELDQLANLIGAHLRKTDAVQRTRDREIGIVLVEAVGEETRAPLARVQVAAALHLPALELRIGCAAAGAGRTWQEAWRWAGALLVADAAIPAAACGGRGAEAGRSRLRSGFGRAARSGGSAPSTCTSRSAAAACTTAPARGCSAQYSRLNTAAPQAFTATPASAASQKTRVKRRPPSASSTIRYGV